jgi:hypothetical protein
MLKPQDIVILLIILAHKDNENWPQHQLATHLCLSISAVNASLNRLSKSGLVNLGFHDKRYQLVAASCLELLLYGVKYFFPAQMGDYTAGIPTSYAAPVFNGQIVLGQDPVPVWPSAEGNRRGLALEPLYHCVPNSLIRYPDQEFYDLLSLVDALRQGRARERNIATKLLKEKIHRVKSK